ncbi:MAG: fatty acid desaturase [Candidatus Obscuribacterales bacterium]
MSRDPREFITWALAFSIYACFIALTLASAKIPAVLLFFFGGFIVCLHGSLQHETIHGHPTGNRLVNSLLAYAPLGVIYPYPIYRSTHIQHHETENLTNPLEDPESYYITRQSWQNELPPVRALLLFNNTLLGRLVLGPVILTWRFYTSEIKKLAGGDTTNLPAWLIHIVLVTALFAYLTLVCKMPVWTYLACFVYPGLSLTLLRSYAEHQSARTASQRTAIVETAIPFRVLYLNNNYHYLHHKLPRIPWYELRNLYFKEREALLAENGSYFFNGYSEIFRKYAFKMRSPLVFEEAVEKDLIPLEAQEKFAADLEIETQGQNGKALPDYP